MAASAVGRNEDIRRTLALAQGSDVLRAGTERLRSLLPGSWRLDEARSRARSAGTAVDSVLRLRAPSGASVVLFVGAKRVVNTRDVPLLLESLQRAADNASDDDAVLPVMMARYLAPPTRERIAAGGAGYVDATGNVLLSSDTPALVLRDRGKDRDPWRGRGRPRGTLQGAPAARAVRALVDFTPPYTVPELAARAGTSTGATYRVVELLEGEGLLMRTPYGPISEVQWRPMLERWSQDYGFAASNTVQTFLEPRGLDALTKRLREAPDLEYVMTGSVAANLVAPYAPARLATIYVRDLANAAERLGLRAVESGANVALATARYDVVFDRAQTIEGSRIAAPSQVAVDLLTGPGRNPSEAVALLDWMERNERDWRR